MEREKGLAAEVDQDLSKMNRVVRRATSLGIGVGTGGLVAGFINGSSAERVLGTVVIVGSVGVRRAIRRRLK